MNGKASVPHKVSRMDVARVVGVSHTTVSNVVNGKGYVSAEVKDKVIRAIHEMGYAPNPIAKSLSTRTAQAVAIFVENMNNPFIVEMVSCISNRLHAFGYRSFMVERAWADQEYIKTMAQGLCDGVILADGDYRIDSKSIRLLNERSIPMVAHGFETDIGIYTVNPEFERGMLQILSHLQDLGHRRVAFVGECQEGPRQRYQWYLDCCMKLNLESDPILGVQTGTTDHWSLEAGYLAGIGLLTRRSGATAVVCANDLLAMGMMRACYEMGLSVPRDISIVGWDDIPQSSYTCPPLTTLRVDRDILAARLVDGLIGAIKGVETPPVQVVGEMIIRHSTSYPS